MRPEASELRVQHRATGLPFVSNGFVQALQGWLLALTQATSPAQMQQQLGHSCCICAVDVA